MWQRRRWYVCRAWNINDFGKCQHRGFDPDKVSKIKNEDKKNDLNVPGPSLLTVFKIGNSSNSQLSHLPLWFLVIFKLKHQSNPRVYVMRRRPKPNFRDTTETLVRVSTTQTRGDKKPVKDSLRFRSESFSPYKTAAAWRCAMYQYTSFATVPLQTQSVAIFWTFPSLSEHDLLTPALSWVLIGSWSWYLEA